MEAATETHSGYGESIYGFAGRDFRLGHTNSIPELFSGLRNARSSGSEVLRSHHGPE